MRQQLVVIFLLCLDLVRDWGYLKQGLLLSIDPVPLFLEKILFFFALFGFQALQLLGLTLADETEDKRGEDTGDGEDYGLYEHLTES